jgi:hypothetical protein
MHTIMQARYLRDVSAYAQTQEREEGKNQIMLGDNGGDALLQHELVRTTREVMSVG